MENNRSYTLRDFWLAVSRISSVEKSMKLIGYKENSQIPVKAGDEVTILKGTQIRYRGNTLTAKRTYKIKVNHILNGRTSNGIHRYHHPEYYTTVNPSVRWPGRGGYWSEVDINDLPEISSL
jgi:hypothetical protein